jgi:hypothetical protein
MLVLIDNQLEQAITDTMITIEITKRQKDSLVLKSIAEDGLKFSSSEKIFNNDTVYVLTRLSQKLPYRFADLQYPNLEIPSSFSEDLKLSQLNKIEPYIDSIILKTYFKTGEPEMDKLRKFELDSILKPFELNRIEREVSLKPINKFVDFVKNPLN